MIDGLEVPTRGVHDQGALMHHKYIVRDGADVWTGSTNWTDDAFSVRRTRSCACRRRRSPRLCRNFEQLWSKGGSSRAAAGPVVDARRRRRRAAVFSPHGPSLAHRAAERIAAAEHACGSCPR